MLTPQQVQQRDERRKLMSPEERQLAALETIADSMFDIKLELMNLNRNVQAIAAKGSKPF